jgi:hypothetical protein
MRLIRRSDGLAVIGSVTSSPDGKPVVTVDGQPFEPPRLMEYTLSEATLHERMELFRGGYEQALRRG